MRDVHTGRRYPTIAPARHGTRSASAIEVVVSGRPRLRGRTRTDLVRPAQAPADPGPDATAALAAAPAHGKSPRSTVCFRRSIPATHRLQPRPRLIRRGEFIPDGSDGQPRTHRHRHRAPRPDGGIPGAGPGTTGGPEIG